MKYPGSTTSEPDWSATRAVLCLAFLFLMSTWPVHAQAPDEAFQRGLEAYEDAHYSAAVSAFNRAVQVDPTYGPAGAGSASYWLGRSLAAAADTATALRTWREGIEAFDAEGTFSARLADAYVRAVFTRGDESDFPYAAELYLRLLARADLPQGPEGEIAVRHLAQLEPLVPEDWHGRIFADDTDAARGRIDLQPDAGTAAAAWWRREDPEPAADENPRLIEHLRRVGEAEERFSNHRDAAGFDDRGRIFVRFGEPSYRRKIQSVELFQMVHPKIQHIPDNEYWVYVHVSAEAKYLFVQQQGAYRIGGVVDLLPSALQTYKVARAWESDFSSVPRRVTVGDALPILRDFYGQLVTHNVDYAGAFESVRAATDGDPSAPHPISIVHEASHTDRQIERTREANVPREHSEALPEIAPLPLETHLARFLDEDGATRTEVYWAPEPGALDPAADRPDLAEGAARTFLIEAALVELDSDYRRERSAPHYLEAGPAETAPGSTTPVQTLIAEPGDALFHLALDVRQYFAQSPDEARPELLLKRSVTRFDSLRALRGDGRALEMSDLRPLLLPDLEAEAELAQMAPEETRRLAYPFRKLPADAPLALYFEVYHLTFGDGDRTRYRVEYEIERRTERGWLGQLLRGADEQRTATTFEREGASRRAEELIVIDLSELGEERPGELRLTVRVTDEVTGETRERQLRFETFDPEAE